jgi:hypothetical protein
VAEANGVDPSGRRCACRQGNAKVDGPAEGKIGGAPPPPRKMPERAQKIVELALGSR